jgi:hypothetical protein
MIAERRAYIIVGSLAKDLQVIASAIRARRRQKCWRAALRRPQ